MRRKTGSYLLAAAALALAVGVAQPSSAAPASGPAVLAGTVTISGSVPGYVPVRVTREMLLPNPFVDADRGAVAVTGGGRMSGFALVQDGLAGPAIIGGLSPFTKAETQERGVFVGDPGGFRRGGDFVVPPGRYKLYLATDGKPTTVTLKFRGGTGRSILKPTVRTRETVQSGPASINTPGLYTAGFDTPASASVHLSLPSFTTAAHTESVFTRCYFVTKPQGPNPYLPGCPSTEPRTGLLAVQPVSDEFVGNGRYTYPLFALNLFGEHFGSGGSWTNGSVLTGSDYSHFFLDLAPSNAKTQPAPAKPAAAAAPQQPPAAPAPAPAPGGAGVAASDTLPATGLSSPALALAPGLLLAAAATRRARSNDR